MRAREFVFEDEPEEFAPQSSVGTQGPAPSQLADRQKQNRLAQLGNKAQPAPAASDKQKQPGFFGGLAQGFKKGMGMDPEQSLARGVAGKALSSVGMHATADAVANPVLQKQTQQTPAAQAAEKAADSPNAPPPKVGSMIKDPRFGYVRVLPNAPGQGGVHLDTTKVLGHPIYVDQRDMQG